MNDASALLNTTVTCKNSQGQTISASMLRLRRYSAAFEVYNPYSLLQLSEVLRDFQIRMNERLVYSGNAYVSGLVNTGTLVVCEVTLENSWLDIDFQSERYGFNSFSQQFSEFIEEWKGANYVDADFKINTADVQSLLVGVQRWMNQVDLGIRNTSSSSWDEIEKETLRSLKTQLVDQIHPAMASFEEAAMRVPEEREDTHKFYFRRQIHPLVLCSPFAYRTYYKPLGYAGDYEMVNMMFAEPFQGSSLFAKTVNYTFLETAPVRAHRNRIRYLTEKTLEVIEGNEGRPVKIFNLGCGPAQEVQNLLKDEELVDLAEYTLLDFNEETLQYSGSILNQLVENHGRRTNIETIKRSVHQLLRQASTGDRDLPWEHYDFVYCAGLFDYLSQRVCRRLTDLLFRLMRPGGLLIVTNVSKTNPNIAMMKYLLEWNLVYRDEDDMRDLAPRGDHVVYEVKKEETGVNLFLEVQHVRPE